MAGNSAGRLLITSSEQARIDSLPEASGNMSLMSYSKAPSAQNGPTRSVMGAAATSALKRQRIENRPHEEKEVTSPSTRKFLPEDEEEPLVINVSDSKIPDRIIKFLEARKKDFAGLLKKKKSVLGQVASLKELESKRLPINSHKIKLPPTTFLSEEANQAYVSDCQPLLDTLNGQFRSSSQV
jgi:hypothetical protein